MSEFFAFKERELSKKKKNQKVQRLFGHTSFLLHIHMHVFSAWNFFLKKLYAQYVINKQKKKQQKILKELRNYESDAPKILPNEDSSDSQKIFGSDHEGNSLIVKFTRRRHRIAELWLILRLKNGQQYTTYTLPGL
jgi:hypothetical protein